MLLWAEVIYTAPYDPEMEDDKQDVFITSLEVVDGGRALAILSEDGAEYRLDLATREVTRLRIADD